MEENKKENDQLISKEKFDELVHIYNKDKNGVTGATSKPTYNKELKKKQIIALIEYHKQESSEPHLSLKGLRKLPKSKTDDTKHIERALNKYRLVMKKKHLKWVKVLNSLIED